MPPRAPATAAARPEVRAHPSTAPRRRFGATGTGPATPDAPSAHARGFRPESAEAPKPTTRPRGGRTLTRTEQRYAEVRDQRREREMKSEIRREQFRPVEAAARPFRSTSRVLVAEFVACLVMIVLKPTEPGPGQQSVEGSGAFESTIPQLVAVMVVFMLLAALGAAGPNQQRIANLFGGAMAVTLLFKNHATVVNSITTLASAKQHPGYNAAPAQDTSHPQAG